jgi:SAM-dependent methyltransferase
MDEQEHTKRTLRYFKQAALEKEGFYDVSDVGDYQHTLWQRRVRAYLKSRIMRLGKSCHSLVDVGCGNGDFIRELAGDVAEMNCRGHDFSSEMIEVAERRYGGIPNLTYRTQDLLNPTPEAGQYDIVVCLNMFHHLHENDLDRGMDALAALTKKVLLFEMKNENNFWNRKFRPMDSFPVNLLSPQRARQHLASKGLTFQHQWNIFGLGFLSPIVILEFHRD